MKAITPLTQNYFRREIEIWQHRHTSRSGALVNAPLSLTIQIYLQNTNNEVAFNDSKLEIKITTDAESKTITIEDSGVGLGKDEMVKTLGTIARSGSKEFLAGAKI